MDTLKLHTQSHDFEANLWIGGTRTLIIYLSSSFTGGLYVSIVLIYALPFLLHIKCTTVHMVPNVTFWSPDMTAVRLYPLHSSYYFRIAKIENEDIYSTVRIATIYGKRSWTVKWT